MKQFITPLLSVLQNNPHHRRLAVALGALLLASGVTAYSIAPPSPDVANLPVRQLIENIAPIDTSAQMDSELVAPMVLYRSEITRPSDSLNTLLRRLGVSGIAAASFLRRDTVSRTLLAGTPAKFVSIEADDKHQLQRLTARWPNEDGDQFSRLVVELGSKGYTSRMEMGQLERSVQLTSATVRSSLNVAAREAKLPKPIAAQLADVFTRVPDLEVGLSAGDSFRVVYETLEVDGEVLRTGNLLGAEFVKNGKQHQVMWFQEPGQKGGFYTLDGQSIDRDAMSLPLDSPRVSSGYGMRIHPVYGQAKAHEGTDFASPSGTPIRSAAQGIVTFAGWKQGYGKFVLVKHRGQKATAYAHLSRIQVRKGQRVAIGDLLGAVGQTGTTTGPNLHFEYLVKGRPQDPQEITRQSDERSIPLTSSRDFERLARTMRRQLDTASRMAQASAD
jgi:murein DD-endopeptidase MepM/ murein hydrolase activator NlpD